MAKVLTTGDAFDGAVAWLLSDGSGRNIQVQVLDSSTFPAPTWASVLAVGNVSGGSNVIIEGTDELQFSITPGTALIRIADGLRFVANATDAVFINDVVMRLESGVELELDTNPGPAVIRGTDGLELRDGADAVLVLDTEVRPQVALLRWADGVTPTVSQSSAAVGNGQQMTIRAQAGAGGSNGGALLLTSGTGVTSGDVLLRPNTGGTTDGAVRIQQRVGPTNAISVGPTGLAFWAGTPAVAPSVTGSRGGNAALASLLTTLASMGLITNNTTA